MTPPDLTFWTQLLVRLAVEAACVVFTASLVERLVRPSFWRRTVWQSAVVCLLLLTASELSGFGRGLASFLFGRARPEQKIVVLTQPVESSPLPSRSVSASPLPVPSSLPQISFASAQVTAPVTVPVVEAAPEIVRPVWWPGLLWLAGALLVLGRVATAQILFISLRRRRLHPASADLNNRLAAILQRLAIRRKICLLQSPGLNAPIAFGVLHPTIVLPVDFTAKFSRTEQDAMLAHELAHLAARDPLWYLLANVSSAALWWHPPTWWVRRRLHRASELAADEAAALFPQGPAALAECLVTLGRQMTQPPGANWIGVAGGGFRSHLAERVQRLLHLSNTAPQPPCGWRAHAARLAAITAIAAAALTLSGCLQNRDPAPPPTLQANLTQSWNTSPAATLWHSAHAPKSAATPPAPELVKVQLVKPAESIVDKTNQDASPIVTNSVPSQAEVGKAVTAEIQDGKLHYKVVRYDAAAAQSQELPQPNAYTNTSATIYSEIIRALESRRIEAILDYNDHSNTLSILHNLQAQGKLDQGIARVERGQAGQDLFALSARVPIAQDNLTHVREGYGPKSDQYVTSLKAYNEATNSYHLRVMEILTGWESLVDHDKNYLDFISDQEQQLIKETQELPQPNAYTNTSATIYSEIIRALESRRIEAILDYNDHSNTLSILHNLQAQGKLDQGIARVERGQAGQDLFALSARVPIAQDNLTHVREGYGPKSDQYVTSLKAYNEATNSYHLRVMEILTGWESLVDHDKNYLDFISDQEQQLIKETRDKEAAPSMQSTNAESSSTPQPYPTNLFYTSPGRQTILRKLQSMISSETNFPGLDQGLPLSELMRDLKRETQRLDVDHYGINFGYNSHAGNAPSDLPNPPFHTPMPVDAKDITVKISPSLEGIPLLDALDAICKAAELPPGATDGRLAYAIENYAVIFFITPLQPPPLYTRTYHEEPLALLSSLQELFPGAGPDASSPRTNANLQDNALMSRYFASLGLNLTNQGGFSLFNSYTGSILVRASANDMDAVQRAIEDLAKLPHQPSPPLNPAYAEKQTETASFGTRMFGFGLGRNTFTSEDLPQFLTSIGLNLTNNGVSLIFRNGEVLVRAHEQDLETVFEAMQLLNEVPPEVTLEVKFAIVAAADYKSLGLLRSDDFQVRAGLAPAPPGIIAILHEQQFRAVLDSITHMDGSGLLSAPRVTTLSGRQAHLAINDFTKKEVNNNYSGSNVSSPSNSLPSFTDGPSVDVLPVVSADGYAIKMTVIPTYTEFIGYDISGPFIPNAAAPTAGSGATATAVLPLPHYRVRQAVVTTNVWDGDTIVLRAPVSVNATNQQQDMLIFITPRIIDPAGNPLHTDEQMPLAQPLSTQGTNTSR